MPAPVRYARSGDVSIAFAERGEGPADVVLVPGFVSNVGSVDRGLIARPLLEGLTRFARVVLFDKRGTGLSERAVGIADLETRMDDVRAVMDSVGLERAHLLGFSEGGPMSILFAATYPERVESLGLFGSFARFVQGEDHPWMPTRDERAEMARLGSEYWGSGLALATFLPPDERTDDVIAELADAEMAGATPMAVRQVLEMNMRIDVRSVLSTITAPTLVIHDPADQQVPFESGRYLADHIPGAEFVEADLGAHASTRGRAAAWFQDYEELVSGHRSTGPVDRVLASVLFTDIVDSTAIAADRGDREWRALLDRHDEYVNRAVKEHRGVLVKTTGDGALARFDGPGRAVACAGRIGEAVAGLGLDTRIGVHTGEIELRDGNDIGGIAVHIASRVADQARPGEVLVSRTVKDLTAGSSLRFEDRGEYDLKGVPEPWALYTVVA